jgi:CubicO group peptidase (beta-lactamase class C family)
MAYRPFGGANSTVNDMARFVAMLLADLLDLRKQSGQARRRRLRIGSDTAGHEQAGGGQCAD